MLDSPPCKKRNEIQVSTIKQYFKVHPAYIVHVGMEVIDATWPGYFCYI
jgi:hypothetical protein